MVACNSSLHFTNFGFVEFEHKSRAVCFLLSSAFYKCNHNSQPSNHFMANINNTYQTSSVLAYRIHHMTYHLPHLYYPAWAGTLWYTSDHSTPHGVEESNHPRASQRLGKSGQCSPELYKPQLDRTWSVINGWTNAKRERHKLLTDTIVKNTLTKGNCVNIEDPKYITYLYSTDEWTYQAA